MKTISQPAVITPSILLLALFAGAIVFIGVTGKRVPLLSNVRVDIVLLVIIGMTMCTQGGIGRVAASGQWSHPLAIIGRLFRFSFPLDRSPSNRNGPVIFPSSTGPTQGSPFGETFSCVQRPHNLFVSSKS